jgi:AcrR family transcriptional regulator
MGLEPSALPGAGFDGERAETAILRAALDVLRRNPARRLTMDAVAQAAFMSRSGLYRYFAGSEAVMDRLVSDTGRALLIAVAPYLHGGSDPRGEIHRALLRAHRVLVMREPVIRAVTSGPNRTEHPERLLLGEIRAGAIARVNQDRARGVAPPGPDAHVLVSMLLAMTCASVRDVGPSRSMTAGEFIALETVWWRAVYAVD